MTEDDDEPENVPTLVGGSLSARVHHLELLQKKAPSVTEYERLARRVHALEKGTPDIRRFYVMLVCSVIMQMALVSLAVWARK